MKNFPPNLDPKIATISAVAIGIALIDNFTAAEQNAIGNWFITIGQTLLNNSAWQAMIENRIIGSTLNINSEKYKKTGDPYMDNKSWVDSPTKKEIDKIKRIIKIMQDEIDNLQEKKNY